MKTTFYDDFTDIADEIMDGEFHGDYLDWSSATDENRAQVFDDIVAIIANFKPEPSLNHCENNIELMFEIKQRIKEALAFWAEREQVNVRCPLEVDDDF